MRLSLVLFEKIKLPKGNLYKGKYRLVKDVTGMDVKNKQRDFAVEEMNMFYLRHPYIKAKEYEGVEDDLGITVPEGVKVMTERAIRFRRNGWTKDIDTQMALLDKYSKWD